MSTEQDDLLLSLESSLRNTLYTFGENSKQYQSIKAMVDEHIAKTQSTSHEAEKSAPAKDSNAGFVVELAFRPKVQQ